MDNHDSSPKSPVFDLEKLRLSQDFSAELGVKKILTTVPVRKPNKHEFVRVHPSPDYYIETALLELKEERETYLIAPELRAEIPGELVPKRLFTAVNRQGVVMLWPIRMPGEDGRLDNWNLSATDAAERAVSNWIRVTSNLSLGAYEIFQASGDLAPPKWPEVSLLELLEIAFRQRYIDDPNHVVLRRLRGEI